MTDLCHVGALEEASSRRRQMLRTAFGPTIAAALADPTVLEVMLNPDGRLWIDRTTDGRKDTGEAWPANRLRQPAAPIAPRRPVASCRLRAQR